MAKKNKQNPDDATLDLGFEEMEAASVQESGPVTVLGKTFPNDEERRAYFREQLRAKLPELRGIEGFPIGTDDDIVNLSDPPYYTACPNPWLNDFIAEWEEEKLQLEKEGKRHPNVVVNEPYAADVVGIKNDSAYRAHTYHTKVPQEIIIRYLLHYTQPGDIVFDGYAGTGMTGLASQACDNPVSELKNKITSKTKTIESIVWGRRHAICNDLSPYASLIAYNYNSPLDQDLLQTEISRITKELYAEIGWMYQTKHTNEKLGEIKCVIWSDVVLCPSCGEEFDLWHSVVDKKNKLLKSEFSCPYCGVKQTTSDINKAVESVFDNISNEVVKSVKSIPVRIVYVIDNKRYEKDPDEFDLETLSKIESLPFSIWAPSDLYMGIGKNWGDTWRKGVHCGITRVHQFYTKRNLFALALFLEKIQKSHIPHKAKFLFTGMVNRSTKMNRVHFTKYLKGGTDWDAGHLKGTLYVPSMPVESSVLAQISNKLGRFLKAQPMLPKVNDNALSVCSASSNLIEDNSIDYIFTDPPFGDNIMYSELNYLPEAWLKVKTNNSDEAIINNSTNKGLFEYLNMMREGFSEFYRILKPGKWMTVEFSNTSASVWNSIQQSLTAAGFVIANVSSLNKGQGGMRAITTTTAVKQDLAISCYKPSIKFSCDTEVAPDIWDFFEEHISHLNIFQELNDKTMFIPERDIRILYDRVVSFYIQRNYPVPIDAKQFQAGLRERYAERDGMYFTPSQVVKYDEMRKRTEGFQASLFFVDSEQGGIAWLNNELATPQTYQDLQPKWMQAINGVRKGDILPELMQILEENFIKERDGKWRKPNLQDDVDLAALRMKALMREFKVYVEVARKPKGKIKEARVEALRTGFKQCYQEKDFATIVAVGDRIPQNLLTEDEQLLQFYEIATSRI